MEDGGLCDLVKLGTNLQWPGDLQMATQKDGQTAAQTAKDDRASVRSDVVSVKESEKELLVNSEKKRGGGADDKTMLASQKKEEFVENQLPEKAAQVFLPAVTVLRASASSPRENQEIWEMESQKSPLLVPPGKPHNYNHHQCPFDSDEATAQSGCGHGCPSREVLKVGVSLMSAAMFFPFLAWGGYVFLPFDAPLLDDTPLRLVYTLRCSVFAITPIVLGWLVLGASRLKYGVIRPLFDDVVGFQVVGIHGRFLSDSSSLFLIYFLQLVVLAMYLSQEQMKLVPLLAIIFAFGRLVYWVAAAFGSSVRGFGFGLSFLPSVAMMVANFYFVFTMEAAGAIFSHPPSPEDLLPPPESKQRFWG